MTWVSARWRGSIASLLALLALAALSACGSSSPAAGGSGSSGGKFVVGHTYPDLQNPYYVNVRQSLESQLKKAGDTYLATDSQQDPAKQATDIENLIARHVNLLIVDAVDPQAVVPGIEAANRANIPVLALIRKPEGGDIASMVYFNSIEHGRVACQYIVDRLHGKGNVVELQGILATQPGRERSQGCEQALSKAPGIKLVAKQPANFDRPHAFNAMQDILRAHPQVDAVFAGNDEEALGAVQAFKAAGIDPSKKVITSVDGTQAGLQAICDGQISATMATIARHEADLAAGVVKDIQDGKKPPKQVLFQGTFATASNVRDVIKRSGFNVSSCPKAQ
jgi:ribose transport system substrate-binding protein